MKSAEQLTNERHSLAHLLAAAVLELWPDTKNTIGPAVDNGFYYDFEFATPLPEGALEKIEKKMREILKTWKGFEAKEVSQADAEKHFAENPYKLELIKEIAEKGEKITLYTSGSFTDLCRGGHVENAQDIPADSFKLDRVAGAYWRGDEKNKMLTRIYGLAFSTKADLDAYLVQKEEALKRDHRKIGKELDLFTFSDLVGAGLPLFTPKGTVLRDQLTDFSEQLQKKGGFKKVWIPHITKIDLYKKSGHWDKFGDELFLVKSQETDDQFALKPMNCPHHAQIYASRPRSYRDLPIRLMETTTCYRDEKKGEMVGLSRVRSLNQDDAHVFCRMDQIEQEFFTIMTMIKEMYKGLGLSFKARLSFRDPANPTKYLGEEENWNNAQTIIEDIAKKLELDYVVAIGEAAFYGPKIDILVTDALGREWQCATQQLDFVQPARFELEYTDVDGTKKTPVMIHKALLGSIERFLSVYIEHTAGNFPLWLAPVQVKIIPVTEDQNEYAKIISDKLETAGIRIELETGKEGLGKKVRQAKLEKVPYWIVIGGKEVEANKVTLESRDNGQLGQMDIEEVLTKLTSEVSTKKY